MIREEFEQIAKMLKVYRDCVTKENYEAWWLSLKGYDFETIEKAVSDYIRTGKFTPTPAHIIDMIPKATPQTSYVPRYETVNGVTLKVIQCRRCKDTGLREYTDEDGRVYGKPCNCPAGHDKYHWGWLNEEQQKGYAKKHGGHGEVVGECWYEFDDI